MKIIERIRKWFIATKQLPTAYCQRDSDETIWKNTYKDNFTIADITLQIFCSAFLFRVEDRFKLRPNDKFIDIYRAIYPSKWTPDALEHLFLIEGMEKKFGFRFNDKELESIKTLKDLVEKAITAQPGVVADPSRLQSSNHESESKS